MVYPKPHNCFLRVKRTSTEVVRPPRDSLRMTDELNFLTYGVTGISLGVFVVFFRLSFYVSDLYVPAYRSFSMTEQVNWCSRMGSTLHAVVICTGMLICIMQQNWDSELHPLLSVNLARAFFSWSIAYFIYDLVVVVYWRLPMWKVFVAHHIVAMTPFCIFNFYRGNCLADTYLLSFYLLVEVCVIPMNIVAFLDDVGEKHSRAHIVFSYLSFISWVAARGVLPIYTLYILWAVMLPSVDFHAPGAWICVGPAIVCGHLISGFCVGCLLFVITPEFLARWKKDDSSKVKDQSDSERLESGSIRID